MCLQIHTGVTLFGREYLVYARCTKGSRWVIDEAFAVGEEPLWTYHGGETASDASTEFYKERTNVNWMKEVSSTGRSKIYGGLQLS